MLKQLAIVGPSVNDVGGKLLSMLESIVVCEYTSSDPESGDGFVVTVKTDKLLGAMFLSIPYRQLQSAVRNTNRVFVDTNGYSVAGSFRKDFLIRLLA